MTDKVDLSGGLTEPAQEPTQDQKDAQDSVDVAGLPSKFNSVTDLAEAYENLQAEFTKTRQKLSEQSTEPEEGSDDSGSQPTETEPEDSPTEPADEGSDPVELWEAAKEVVGDESNYDSMARWAEDNLSPEALQAYNSLIETGTPDQVRLAVKGLYGDFVEAGGAEPTNQVHGSGSSGISATGYESQAQMVRDMNNPLYDSDPAFRAEVQKKLAATTAF